jgi:putative endonuclease
MGLSVYILLCFDNSYYTGVTNDVEKRVQQHSFGINPECYTYSRRPVALKWANWFKINSEAFHWETQIKGWTRAKKEALINGEFELLPGLSECRNATSHKNFKGKK